MILFLLMIVLIKFTAFLILAGGLDDAAWLACVITPPAGI